MRTHIYCAGGCVPTSSRYICAPGERARERERESEREGGREGGRERERERKYQDVFGFEIAVDKAELVHEFQSYLRYADTYI